MNLPLQIEALADCAGGKELYKLEGSFSDTIALLSYSFGNKLTGEITRICMEAGYKIDDILFITGFSSELQREGTKFDSKTNLRVMDINGKITAVFYQVATIKNQ